MHLGCDRGLTIVQNCKNARKCRFQRHGGKRVGVYGMHYALKNDAGKAG